MTKGRLNFTIKNLESINNSISGRDTYQDIQEPHLRLRVGITGRKIFYYVRKIEKKVSWIKLDAFPDMTIFQARRKCTELSAKYASGEDPIEIKKQRKKELNFEGLFNLFFELHSKPLKKSWKWDLLNYKNHLQSISKKALREISPEVISRLHKFIGAKSGHGQANRTLALIKTVFNFGIKQRFFNGANPAYGIMMFREKSRDRFLDAEELRRFFEALETEPNQDMRDFFLLALFTGARRGNLQAMKWGNLDLDAGVWTVPGDESKNGEPMKIVLSRESIDILKRRKSVIASLFVFPSKSKTGHLTEPKAAWKNLLKRAGIEGVWIHDLRRTLGSWQAAGGSSLPVIGKSLGHKNQSTTAIYARLNLDPVRESVNRAIDAMREAGK